MPSKKMSSLWLKNLKHTNKGRVEYFDTETKGLVLRVGTSTMTWFSMYRISDSKKLKRYKIGRYPSLSLKDARAVSAEIKVKAAKGQDPAAEKKAEREDMLSAPTFDYLVEVYLSRHAKRFKRPKSITEDERIIQKDLLPAWSGMKARDIQRRHVISLLDDVAERGPVMANRTLALASTIFNVGVDRELIEYNPCYRVKKPGGKEQSRDRVLADNEVRKVWTSFDLLKPKMMYLMRIRFLTGQRGSEVCSMSWDDIDINNKVWIIPGENTKNSKEHSVPLSTQAIDNLKELKIFLESDNARRLKRGLEPVEDKWVFPSTHSSATGYIKNVQKAAQKVQFESGVDDFRLHDMRRTMASKMAGTGVSEFVIGKVLNHTNDTITSVYNRHSYDPEKRKALQKWGDKLDQIVKGRTAKIVNLK